MAVFVEGNLLTTPTVASQVIDSGMANLNSPIGNVLCIIGRSDSGTPKSVLRIGSPGQAKEVLQSGELYDAVNLAFSASAQTFAPQTILAIRVNPAVQSTAVLKTDGNVTTINLTSTDYGQRVNALKINVAAGSLKGKRITTKLNNITYQQDNIARDAFTIQYTGVGTTATMSITDGTITLVANSITTTIDLTLFRTVQDVVDKINTDAAFTAKAVSGSETTMALNGLDTVTAVDIKTALYTTKADLQAIVDWINSKDALVNATRVANVGLVPANTSAYVSFSGGSDGVTTTQDWQDCFTAMQAEDLQWVVSLSSSLTIWAMQDAHCQYMSKAGRSERRGFVGGDVGVTATVASQNAFILNSDRTSYCFPAIYLPNDNGDLTLRPAYMLAAMLGGGFGGLTPGNSMTHKSLRISGLEFDNATPTETDPLINAGVLAIYKDKKRGYLVCKAISTWLVDRNYNRVEQSCGAALDYVAATLRAAVEPFIGRRASPFTASEVQSAVDTSLFELAKPEPFGLGILVGDANNPPYKSPRVSIRGDVIMIDVECSPVVPLNYGVISIYAKVWNSLNVLAA